MQLYAKLRKDYANNLRNHYADITQCLRKITQRCLRTIRKIYANVFTQILHTFPMLTQLFYADFTQMIYAISLRILRSLRNSFTQTHLRNYHNFFTQVYANTVFITQVYAKGNLLSSTLRDYFTQLFYAETFTRLRNGNFYAENLKFTQKATY